MNYRRAIYALFMGLLALVLALVLCEFVTMSMGHKLDFSKIPAEAKAVVAESPGTPLTKDQWARIDKIMLRDGGWPSYQTLFLESVEKGWHWFFLMPAVAVCLWIASKKKFVIVEVVLLSFPSILFLIVVVLIRITH